MAPKYKIVRTSGRYTARNRKGDAIVIIEREEENFLRVDYLVPWGWEWECFEGRFDELNEEKARKIFDNYINFSS